MTHAAISWLSTWWLSRLMSTLGPYVRGVVLDVGCGSAPYRGTFDVERHITLDWPNTVHDQSNIDVFASAESLPIKSDSVDTVLCTEVLEHLRDPSSAVAEAARVLRPGGHLVLTVPFLFGIHERPHDYFRYTEYGLRRLLEQHRLEVVHLAARGGSMAVIVDVGSKLVHRLMSVGLQAARAPAWLRARALEAIAGGPQRMVAALTEIGERIAPRLTDAIGGKHATLGYVVVARRRMPA